MALPTYAKPWMTGLEFEDDVALSAISHLYPWLFQEDEVFVHGRFPAAVLISIIGREIGEVIVGHKRINRAFNCDDIIHATHCDELNAITILTIRKRQLKS